MTQLIEFYMPDVGEGIAEAEVLEWLVEVGDHVTADQPIVQVETDKSVVDIPAPVTGTLLKQAIPRGEFVKVEQLLAIIGDPGSLPEEPDVPATETPTGGGPDDDTRRTDEAPRVIASEPTAPRKRPMASPRTRRLARQQNVDLATVVGTGPHGRILESDLASSAPSTPSAPAAAATHRTTTDRTDEVVQLRGLRRSIAQSMTEALTIPHVTEFREVDASNILAARAALRPAFEANGLRLSVFPLLLKAVIRALEIAPSMNATYEATAGTLTKHAGVHVGVATATDDGLIVPVVRDADLLNLTDLSQEVERLAERARTRSATPDELTGGSFTVTNFGSFGAWLGNPVIRPPEVGIAGFGRITERVIALDGQPVVRPVLPIVVATDHRINDGAHLAGFVNALAEAVAQPLLLLS